MGKTSEYYERLHKEIGKQVALTESQVKFIRDFHFRLNATPQEMLVYVEKKLSRKRHEGKKEYCRGLIKFLKNITVNQFQLIVKTE